MGISGALSLVRTALAGALVRSFRRRGPSLIEAVLVEEGAKGPLQN